MDDAAIDLGSRRHLFIDLSLAERADHVALRVKPPRLGGVAIGRDRAWEHHLHFIATVVDDQGLARMWYSSSYPGHVLASYRHGYAESDDGVQWRKPNPGLVEVNGRRDMNVVPPTPRYATVFIDPTAPSSQRYKVFGLNQDPEIGALGYGVFVSSDGLVFRESGCNGIRAAGDTQNLAFWDNRLGRYVAYLRGRSKRSDGSLRRAVARWETTDLTGRMGWDLEGAADERRIVTQRPIVIACDDDDPDDMDIYTPSVVKYPAVDDVYLATMSMYHHFTPAEMQEVDPPCNDGLMDIQLAVSRDGVDWSRPDRRPYVGIDHTGPGQRMVYAVQGLVIRGDTVLQYHIAYDQSHGHKEHNNPGGVIRWTEQRLDGFVAAEFAYAGWEIVTRPLLCEGTRLVLNVDASASGEGRVELQDAQGRPLDGHALADSDRVMGNHVRHTVTWNGSSELGLPHGTPLRLRFVMRAAKLYALQFKHGNVV